MSEIRNPFAEAMALAQGEFKAVAKTAVNPHFKSKYATLDSIIAMAQPILAKHGLFVTHGCELDGEMLNVTTDVHHRSGEFLTCNCKMKPKSLDPQSVGGAITYGRRYGLGMALGVATEDDKDGNEEGEKAKKKEVYETNTPVSVLDDIFSVSTNPISPESEAQTKQNLWKKVCAKAREANITADQIKEYSTITLQKVSSKDWNLEDYEMVLEWIAYKKGNK